MKTFKDAGGMSKDPMDLSIVKACWTEKLLICASTVQNMIAVAQIGSYPVNILTSLPLLPSKDSMDLELEIHLFLCLCS